LLDFVKFLAKIYIYQTFVYTLVFTIIVSFLKKNFYIKNYFDIQSFY